MGSPASRRASILSSGANIEDNVMTAAEASEDNAENDKES